MTDAQDKKDTQDVKDVKDIQPSDFAKLRDEMQGQFKALKESFDAGMKEKDESIAKLQKTNDDLSKALLRDAFSEPPEKTEKTPEEKEREAYKAFIEERLEMTKEMMKWQ